MLALGSKALETVAVLLNVPVALFAITPVAINVATPPFSKFTLVLIVPLPFAAPQLEPPVAEHVQLTPVRAVENTSVTVAPVTLLGPVFVIRIV